MPLQEHVWSYYSRLRPLRKGSSLQALLLKDGSDKILDKSSIQRIDHVNVLFLIFIIAHGVLGVIEARWTQARFGIASSDSLMGLHHAKIDATSSQGDPPAQYSAIIRLNSLLVRSSEMLCWQPSSVPPCSSAH